MTYRQDYLEGEAEDAAQVLSVGERAQVPAGSFTDLLLTKDYTPLDPEVLEYKFYAPGVGPVLVRRSSTPPPDRVPAVRDVQSVLSCS